MLIRKTIFPVLLVALLSGCALLQATVPPTPQNPQQAWIVATHETAAVQAAANDSVVQGFLNASQYGAICERVIQARAGLAEVRMFLDLGDLKSAQGQMAAVTLLLSETQRLVGGAK